jgi:hypothetical protein
MNKLKEITKEIEFRAKIYPTIIKEAREVYNQYVGLIIEETEFGREQKERLLNYWDNIKEIK